MSESLELARTLARDLAGRAVWHGDRCTWLGPVMDERFPEMPVSATLPADLYAGTAGIALALAEAGAATGDRELLRTAGGALRQSAAVLRRRAAGAGLLDGVLGVALAAARVGRLAGDGELVRLAAGLAAAVPEPVGRDLVGGAAGAALGLLALDPLLPGADHAARARRIAGTLRDAAGDGMGTGLAHGASGVGLALAEAGFHDDAAAVFAAEDAHFDRHAGNWRDLRRARTLPVPSYACAWCHGAPGMALARVRAAEAGVAVAAEPVAAGLATAAAHAAASLAATGADLSLCHGAGGLAEVLALAGDTGPRQRWALAVAGEVADGVPVRCGLPGGRSLGLMTGLAGVVHTLVRTAVPHTPPVLLPRP